MSITLSNILSGVGKDVFTYYADEEKGFAFVYDTGGHTKRLYIETSIGSQLFDQVPIDFEKLALTLSQGLNKEGFLKDVLETLDPDKLLKVNNKLKGNNVKVKDKEGCYSLLISSGKGRPMKLDLRP